MRPYLRAANVTWRGIDLSDVLEMDFRPSEFETYELRPGDILLAEASGSASEVGKPAVWRGERKGVCFQNTLIRVRATDPALVPFLHWHFQRDAQTGRFASASRGVGIHHLGAETMSGWAIAVPPLPEQSRIVEALETQFSRLDAAEANLANSQTRLEQFASQVLSQFVCPGGVVSEWGMASLPPSWEWRRADDVSDKITKGTTPPAAAMSAVDSGVPFLKIQHLNVRGTIKHSDRPVFVPRDVHQTILARSIVRPGDVLMNIVGPPLGQVGIVSDDYPEWNINQAIARFRPHPGVRPGYLAAVMRTAPVLRWLLRRAKTTSGQVNLTLETCRALPIPVPPESAQADICATSDTIDSQLSAAEASVVAARRRCRAIRQSLLRLAFDGGLVPQDPLDEPASVLVERIRRARTAETSAPKKMPVRSRR
jgi:type I restriction enzyme S subunit